jgi:hypothetical protein
VRRRNVQAFLAVLVLIVLLAPVVYLFTKLWSTTSGSASTTTTERAAVSYARPVNALLAALVDAQYAAARRTAVDPSAIKAAVEEVNAADRRSSDPLQVRQRWTQLSREIDNALAQNASGPDALRVYGAPIVLTQALLDRIVDSSKVTRDSGPGYYQLTRVAMHNLPEVVVHAGRVTALALAPGSTAAGRQAGPDPQLTIAADRLVRAVADVSTGLRSGTEPGASYAVDLNLLRPLDEFAGAADALNQAVAALDVPGSGARDPLDAANALVKAKALVLENAVLDAFDGQLAADARGYSGQRRILVGAAGIVLVAAAALLWLCLPRPAAPGTGGTAEPDAGLDGRHSQPVEGAAQRFPDLVDARQLLPQVGAHRSRTVSPESAGTR